MCLSFSCWKLRKKGAEIKTLTLSWCRMKQEDPGIEVTEYITLLKTLEGFCFFIGHKISGLNQFSSIHKPRNLHVP